MDATLAKYVDGYVEAISTDLMQRVEEEWLPGFYYSTLANNAAADALLRQLQNTMQAKLEALRVELKALDWEVEGSA